MPVVRPGLLRAGAASLVLALVAYVGSTAVLDAWVRSHEVGTSGPARLPRVVYNAPETVGTTGRRGPVGPVAAVFAGTRVLDGLSGDLDQPWIAVSSRTGDYRAISAPHLPPATPAATPSRLVVSPDGGLLAWAAEDALVLHDTLTGENRVVDLPGITAVGAFAPDGRRLLVHAGGLKVVAVATGEQGASLGAVPARALPGAVWRPDGTAVSLVDDQLVEVDVASGRRTPSEVGLAGDAQLAWSPSGAHLVSLQEISGAGRLGVWQRAADGTVSPVRSAPAEGVSLRHLLGFTGDDAVAVAGLALESGPITRVFEVPVDGSGRPAQLATLPGAGDNWVGPETLAVATDALLGGTAAFEEPLWPWSHLAKLVSSLVLAVFALGMYVTRRPRQRPGSIK